MFLKQWLKLRKKNRNKEKTELVTQFSDAHRIQHILLKIWLTDKASWSTLLSIFTGVLQLIIKFWSFILQVGFKGLQADWITLELLEICLPLHSLHPLVH